MAARWGSGISGAGRPRRARSAVPAVAAAKEGDSAGPRQRPPIDGPEVEVPRGGRRVLPDARLPCAARALRKEMFRLLDMPSEENDFSGWQMPFPADMPEALGGGPCPVCSLGECGDPACPTFRPKHPDVRAAIERHIVETCREMLGDSLDTYVSVGCGLLAQDWVILERLRAAGMFPRRAVFIELRAIRPVVECEGGDFFQHMVGCKGLDVRQTGYSGILGPEFSFAATVARGAGCSTGMLFEFCSARSYDSIFVEFSAAPDSQPDGDGPQAGSLVFGVMREDELSFVEVQQCWVPDTMHSFLFTVSATGMLRVFADGELLACTQGHPPRAVHRRFLRVGQSHELPHTLFDGHISKIKVWEHAVDFDCCLGSFQAEMERALAQFAQWFANDLSVWTFGSLACYQEAVAQDPRFAADLLVRVDVHEDIDGYEDFACKALGPNGVALTLGGPGNSWRRSGGAFLPLEDTCSELERAYSALRIPWASSRGTGVERSIYCEAAAAGCSCERASSARWPTRRRAPRNRRCFTASAGPPKSTTAPPKSSTAGSQNRGASGVQGHKEGKSAWAARASAAAGGSRADSARGPAVQKPAAPASRPAPAASRSGRKVKGERMVFNHVSLGVEPTFPHADLHSPSEVAPTGIGEPSASQSDTIPSLAEILARLDAEDDSHP